MTNFYKPGMHWSHINIKQNKIMEWNVQGDKSIRDFLGKSEVTELLERPIRNWEDNIEMNLQDT